VAWCQRSLKREKKEKKKKQEKLRVLILEAPCGDFLRSTQINSDQSILTHMDPDQTRQNLETYVARQLRTSWST
jgi:hypothetical protein